MQVTSCAAHVMQYNGWDLTWLGSAWARAKLHSKRRTPDIATNINKCDQQCNPGSFDFGKNDCRGIWHHSIDFNITANAYAKYLNICIFYRPLELEVLPGYLIHPYSHKHDLQQRLLLSLGQNYWVWAYHGRSNPGLNCHHATSATFSSPGSQAAALQICMVRYARFHPLFIAFLQAKPPFHPVFVVLLLPLILKLSQDQPKNPKS